MFKFGKFFNAQGEYLPDPEPVAMPVGFERPPTLAEQVARLVRSNELARLAQSEGMETFEEADDFDVDDDFDPSTPWEQDFDLAAIRAVDRGIVAPPTTTEHHAAKERTKGFFKRKKDKPATPSTVEDDSSVDPQISKDESAVE